MQLLQIITESEIEKDIETEIETRDLYVDEVTGLLFSK